MTLPPVTLAALLAALLATTAVLELCASPPGPDVKPPLLVPPAESTSAADVSAAAAAWSATILQRPLFRPDRQPLAPDAALPVPLPRLSAIVITASGALAIFTGDDGSSSAVKTGGTIDGYHIAAIGPSEVRLTGADGSHIIHPQSAPGPPPASLPLPAILGQHFLDHN